MSSISERFILSEYQLSSNPVAFDWCCQAALCSTFLSVNPLQESEVSFMLHIFFLYKKSDILWVYMHLMLFFTLSAADSSFNEP